ncbi:uncharacterized protein LOC122655176 [Telopea speciosissima]|uniref:uncharacterized protein LOC122655176 n=1 Tax=Telopea speciosissima TaxID=54955 RepID=UPI001CC3C606|nr:uncharacterized protein LOC122655176 [Telopea speciosissima]
MWVSHPDFLSTVSQCWSTTVVGSPLYIFFIKLKLLRAHLRSWNRNTFGIIHQNVCNAEDRVSSAEITCNQDPNEANRGILAEAKKNLHKVLLQEEIFWRQKSRVKWLKEGDRNTKFFHNLVKARRCKKGVECIKDNLASWVIGEARVAEEVIRYFSAIFSSQGSQGDDELLGIIPHVISKEDNNCLVVTPSLEEVKSAIFYLAIDSAPGPDGFFGHFFTACWDIVGVDVWEAVKDFFSGGYLPRSFTSTHLVLIPKKDNPEVMADFCLISLCNFSYNIIAKTLSSCLSMLLPLIISEE